MSRTSILAAFLLLAVAPLVAQKTPPRLEVSISNHQTTFHIGERIPLTLSFTGPDDKSLGLDTAGYDRSGRLNIDIFDIDISTGWSDPLAVFFSQEDGIIGGGLRGYEFLSSKPFELHENLNEWIRFDQPGTYRLTINSNRVSKANRQGFAGSTTVPIKSNAIELTIIPATPEWQAATLARVLAVISNPPQPNHLPSDDFRAAASDLRFLASPAAIEQLTLHLRDDNQNLAGECFFGLMGLPAAMQEVAISALNRRLDDPQFPIYSDFYQALAHLRAPPHPPALLPGNVLDVVAYEKPYIEAWQTVLSALAHKQGLARSITADTLLTSKPSTITREETSQVESALLGDFLSLSHDRQEVLLGYQWDTLDKQAILPAVRTLARLKVADPANREMSAYQAHRAKVAALFRWYQLEPEAALQEVASEINSPTPGFTGADLRFLPRNSFPQLEPVWVNALTSLHDSGHELALLQLIAHFGEGNAAPQLASMLASPSTHWACDEQGAALAYLVQFDDESAQRLLSQAMAARGKQQTGCYKVLLGEISRYAHSSTVEQVAIASLNDPDDSVVIQAIRYLQQFGSAAARKPLQDRYQQWSTAAALSPARFENPEKGNDMSRIYIGQLLGESLLAGQGWIPDESLTSFVLSHCIVQNVCSQFTVLAHPSNAVSITPVFQETQFRVGPFTLESRELLDAKLAQFAPGTSFTFEDFGDHSEHMKTTIADLQKLFESHHLKLVASTPNQAESKNGPLLP